MIVFQRRYPQWMLLTTTTRPRPVLVAFYDKQRMPWTYSKASTRRPKGSHVSKIFRRREDHGTLAMLNGIRLLVFSEIRQDIHGM